MRRQPRGCLLFYIFVFRMEFTFTTLGTSSASPNPHRQTAAHLLRVRGHNYLIDCGEGCQKSLQQQGCGFASIDNIFISHLHGDHLFGIFGLLSTMSMQGRTAPLYIYAPAGFQAIIDFFMDQFADGVKYEIIFTPLRMKGKEMIMENRIIEVYAFPLNHRVDTFGFMFCEKQPQRNVRKWMVEAYNLSLHEIALLKNGESVMREDGEELEVERFTYYPYHPRSFAYCCDTAPFDNLAGWVAGADMIYHDATYSEADSDKAEKYGHSTGVSAARLAVQAGAKQLVLGHFSARYPNAEVIAEEARTVFPGAVAARDGGSYSIPLDKISD